MKVGLLFVTLWDDPPPEDRPHRPNQLEGLDDEEYGMKGKRRQDEDSLFI